MKARVLVILLLLSGAAAAWYFLLYKKSDTSPIEDLIPATSVGVLAIDNANAFYREVEEFDWWDELSEIPLLASGRQLISRLDSLSIQSDITNLPVYISFHITANDQINPLYFVESKGFDWNPDALRTILETTYGAGKVSINQRIYQDQPIREVSLPDGKFSFFLTGNFLAIANTALLIEDVIRAEGQGLSLLSGVDYKLQNSRTGISLLVNAGKLTDLGAVFSAKTAGLKDTNGLFLQMDVQAEADGLLFNGRSVIDINESLGEVSTLKLQNFVPTSASGIQWYGLDVSQVNDIPNFNTDQFLSFHDGELCKVKIDQNNRGEDLAVLVSLDQPEQVDIALSDLATSLMDQNDTLFRESFMDTDITFINKAELPRDLYGNGFSGFDQTYYTIVNNVLIFGNSVEVLKTVLVEYDDENTWGRSIERRRYIDNLIQEANTTAIYNFEFLLEDLTENMKKNWQSFFAQKTGLTSALDLFTFQLSETGAGVLLNASLDFNESIALNARDSDINNKLSEVLTPELTVLADTALFTSPFVVTNHNNGAREFIFQDINNQLYLASDQGVIQWKKPLKMPVNTRIVQVDYYNNKKLQYFFATDSAIHIVDRNGDDVEGFPKTLNTQLPLNGLRVVDYDNTKRYRFAGDDRRGNVYLFDKQGDLLEGWNPKVLESQLLDRPEHVRIRGRDCFVMVEASGRIHLTNRRGEYYPGFPYNANKRLAGDVYVEKGSDFKRSGIIVISDNGEIINLNFEGAVRDRKQLLRPNAGSRFELLRDKLNAGYAVVRKDARKAVVISETRKELFKLPLEKGEVTEFGFYNFRNDSEVFTVTDAGARSVAVYNKSGKVLTGSPLTTVAPIGIIYYQSKGEYELFVNFDNRLTVYKVRK